MLSSEYVKERTEAINEGLLGDNLVDIRKLLGKVLLSVWAVFLHNFMIIAAFVVFNVLFDVLVEFLILRFLGPDWMLLKLAVKWLFGKVFDFIQIYVAYSVLSNVMSFIGTYIAIEASNIKRLIAKIVGEILGASCFLVLVLVLYLFSTIGELDIGGLIDMLISLIGMVLMVGASYLAYVIVGVHLLWVAHDYILCKRINYMCVLPFVVVIDYYLLNFLYHWYLNGGFFSRSWDLLATSFCDYRDLIMDFGKNQLHLLEFEVQYKHKGILYILHHMFQ